MAGSSTRAAALAGALAAAGAAAQEADPAFGFWRVADGDAVVEIAACGAQACGRIAHLSEPLDAQGQPKRDIRNPDPGLADRPVCGMALLGGFTRDAPGVWSGGQIYSARNGKTYSANMEVEDGALRLRGFVGAPLFGETQVWTRTEAPATGC